MTLALDWIAREGHYLAGWWLCVTLAGAAALPLCWRLLGGLPDRGYTLARPVGLLLVASLHWLLGSYGFLDNSSGSIILCWLLVLGGACLFWQQMPGGFSIRDWWGENRALVIASELAFGALFVAMAFYRAHQGDIYSTEKPMELAFISSIQRSPAFPPADPWMSGYAISYYYLGYVMTSALSLLSGVGSAVAFSLTNASQFALTGLCAFGVAYNLARARGKRAATRRAPLSTGALAMIMLALMGNFQFLLIEAPWQSRAAPGEYFAFWGAQERVRQPGVDAPLNPLSLDTSDWSYWWWFRASRVLTDYDLDGNLTGVQPIDEFPAFSFLLADNHPHVLALPFVIAVTGLMLNLLLLRRAPTGWETALYAIALGGLAFLNAWDAPIYLCGFVGVEALRRLMDSEQGRLEAWDWPGLARFGLSLALVAAVAYLPYFVGFRSQAGGMLPNLVTPTYFPRFFIMFAPFIVILTLYLVAEVWRGRASARFNWRLGWRFGGIVLAISLALLAAAALLLAQDYPLRLLPAMRSDIAQSANEWLELLLERRVSHSLTALVLLLGMVVVVARIFPARRHPLREGAVAIRWIEYPASTGFALLLMSMGLALAYLVEFVYLRDNFGVRINTIFKFYYQAWALWSVVGAYALFSMLLDRAAGRPHPLLRWCIGLLAAACILAGSVYTVAGFFHRAIIETGRQGGLASELYFPPAEWDDSIRLVENGQFVSAGMPLFSRVDADANAETATINARRAGIATLDGDAVSIGKPLTLTGDLGAVSDDDRAVLACLRGQVGRGHAVVAEAVRNAYDIQYGRAGALEGIPIVLGWENHERQWRGATYDSAALSRREDMDRLFVATDFAIIEDIMARHGITHILYGQTERSQYGSRVEDTLLGKLPVVCESGQSRVYAAAASAPHIRGR